MRKHVTISNKIENIWETIAVGAGEKFQLNIDLNRGAQRPSVGRFWLLFLLLKKVTRTQAQRCETPLTLNFLMFFKIIERQLLANFSPTEIQR